MSSHAARRGDTCVALTNIGCNLHWGTINRALTWTFAGVLTLAGTFDVSAQDTACPSVDHLSPRLEANIRAQVAPGPGTANNVRAEPGLSGQIIAAIPSGGRFQVLDGPQCADGYVWWQVFYGGETGWTAEGDPDQGRYWLEPLTRPLDPALADSKDDLAYCQEPPEDYTIIDFGFARLNARTVAMLDQATAVYQALGGLLTFDFRDALVQGSYNPGGVSASFGTHDGGGAVDLSVRERGSWNVMEAEIPLMLRALRIAGFAAWLRDADELYPGSPIHIHAIAVGDEEQSEAARAQIDGTFGYFRGFNGLPQDSGRPIPDAYGPFVLCPWMEALGYDDLREIG